MSLKLIFASVLIMMISNVHGQSYVSFYGERHCSGQCIFICYYLSWACKSDFTKYDISPRRASIRCRVAIQLSKPAHVLALQLAGALDGHERRVRDRVQREELRRSRTGQLQFCSLSKHICHRTSQVLPPMLWKNQLCLHFWINDAFILPPS